MIFLIKAAFWLAIVVMLIPADKDSAKTAAPQVGALEALSAAQAAVGDVRQFCSRQPEACAVGGQAVAAFGEKAQAGARMLHEFLAERRAEPASQPAPAVVPGRYTLTPDDAATPWQAPTPRAPLPPRRPA